MFGYPALTRQRSMVEANKSKFDARQALVYEIRVEGHLSYGWIDWFGGLSITLEDNGNTLLTGLITDQAMLFGVLNKIRDMGIPLISVIPVRRGKRSAKDKLNPFLGKAAGYIVLATVLLAIIVNGAQLLFLGYTNAAITGGVVSSALAGIVWSIYKRQKG